MPTFTSLSQFKLGRVIGEGAFGTVREATYLDQKFALKLIKTKLKPEQLNCVEVDNNVNNDIKEAQLLDSLDSPFVLKIFDYFLDVESQQLVLVTELADEGDLSTFLHKIDFDRTNEEHITLILELFIDIVAGMLDLQLNNILHRDLKPQNILIFEDKKLGYRAKIADFNLSKKLDSKFDKTSTQLGTPYFTAPEILEKKEYDRSVDTWSLGVVLFFIFSRQEETNRSNKFPGSFPYEGKDKCKLLKQIKNGIPNPLTNDVPKYIKTLISDMLQINPDARILLVNILLDENFYQVTQKRLPKQSLSWIDDSRYKDCD